MASSNYAQPFRKPYPREVAVTLGITPEAAQKRVNRAVERLRAILGKQGVIAGVAGTWAYQHREAARLDEKVQHRLAAEVRLPERTANRRPAVETERQVSRRLVWSTAISQRYG